MADALSNRQHQLLLEEIEAHRRTGVALKVAKDLAESANLAKTRYIAGMTHELRTPLNSILGYAQILLKDERLHEDCRRAVATIHRSGEHLHELINELLDLARIEAGKVRLDLAPLPMREFLDDLVRMVEPQAAAKRLRFEVQIEGSVPEYVRADAKRLRQILLNLLSNAVRFTDRGQVTLRLDHTREVALLQVIDTGIGIEARDLERIFLPFERGAAGRRSGEPGTGLGLTITHLLTQLMGGELTVDSKPGEGSTFTLRVYLSKIAAPSPREIKRHRPVSGYDGARRRLLIVDDHPMQRQMLAGLLLPLGFDINESTNGQECLDSVRDHPPDAILLDVSMDDMDGWETARRIRAFGVTIPIIMVSANAFENEPQRLAAAGAQAFVDKPVIESELLHALQSHLQIEWLTELPQPDWVEPAANVPELVAMLPPECVATLRHLASIGHANGLSQALDKLLLERPDTAPQVLRLREMAERFAFTELLAVLTQTNAAFTDHEAS